MIVISRRLMNFSVGILKTLAKLVQVEILELITCSATGTGMLVKSGSLLFWGLLPQCVHCIRWLLWGRQGIPQPPPSTCSALLSALKILVRLKSSNICKCPWNIGIGTEYLTILHETAFWLHVYLKVPPELCSSQPQPPTHTIPYVVTNSCCPSDYHSHLVHL